MPECEDCSVELTIEEHRYYGNRCERCERKWHERITAWRLGKAEDPELETFLFGDAPAQCN